MYSLRPSGRKRSVSRATRSPRFFDTLIWRVTERDISGMTTEEKRLSFGKFLTFLAAASFKTINTASLARAAELPVRTVRGWLDAALDAGLLQLIPAFVETLSRRPMLLSCDTGLMCHLLGFTSPETLLRSPMADVVFKTFVALEIIKSRVHNGLTAGVSFYRDRQGHSVDLVLETDGKVFAVQMSPYSLGAAGLKSLAYFRKKTAGCSEGAVISIYPETAVSDEDTRSISLRSI